MTEPEGKTKKSKDSILTTGFAFLVLFPMMYLMLPTVIFLFLSMLPTLVALVIDSNSKTRFKYKWLCIGGLNFAGSLPYLFRLWFGNNTWDGAVGLFLGGGAFLIIYLTALVGWVFYRCIPSVVLSFLEMSDQRRVVHLREAQAKLIAKWGEEVASGVDVRVGHMAALKTKQAPSVQGEAKKP
ncbi:MAG: acyl-CoA synthetase [Alphaproteobacteria bacterium]|nr:acyl-CoA synthetase [Alphaproteobacteria bacterium]